MPRPSTTTRTRHAPIHCVRRPMQESSFFFADFAPRATAGICVRCGAVPVSHELRAIGYHCCARCGDLHGQIADRGTPAAERITDQITPENRCTGQIVGWARPIGEGALDARANGITAPPANARNGRPEPIETNRRTWDQARERLSGRYSNKTGSKRHVGHEFESHTSPKYRQLPNVTQWPDCKLWGCKTDGSTNGMELVSPPVSGDRQIRLLKHIDRFTSSRRWTTNRTCGYHLHLDLPEGLHGLATLWAAYAATWLAWRLLVPESRTYDNTYSRELGSTYDADHFRALIADADHMDETQRDLHTRYYWANPCSYERHGTLEIRLHSATLNWRKAHNWAAAHTRFADAVLSGRLGTPQDWAARVQNTSDRGAWGLMQQSWQDEALAEFYALRASGFGHRMPAQTIDRFTQE